MPILKIFTLTYIFIVFFYIHLYGDIIVTKDDMILNGKIIEDKQNDYIKFANYHGTFHIEYKQIKEIHRTKSYEEDIKIYQDKGKSVDEAEVKTNYQAGLEKLEEQGIMEKVPAQKEISPGRFALLFSPFFNFNMGTLRSEVPYSFGGSVIGDIRLDQFSYLENAFLKNARAELGYFHSENGEKKVSGPRVSAGPLWSFPFSIRSIRFRYTVSPLIGLGWYNVKNNDDKASGIKWNAVFLTGPVADISSAVMLALFARFDYIYDADVPLYGIGFSVGAGFGF